VDVWWGLRVMKERRAGGAGTGLTVDESVAEFGKFFFFTITKL